MRHKDTGHKMPNGVAIGFGAVIFLRAGNDKTGFGEAAQLGFHAVANVKHLALSDALVLAPSRLRTGWEPSRDDHANLTATWPLFCGILCWLGAVQSKRHLCPDRGHLLSTLA